MFRDLSRLASEEFDVIVAGGGVYALTAAWALAARGISVAVLERADFGGATSFNSLKTIHGGIRALQHGSLPEMRAFVRERRAFAVSVPHLVRPLPFVVPTYRHPVRNRALMAMFLAVYDRLAADRNRGVDATLALPPSRTVDRAECLRLNPAIDPTGVTGGAIWHDYQLTAPERFTVALLDSMTSAGAAAANYVAVESIRAVRGTVIGVRARDRLSGGTLDVHGRVVVNAVGPSAWTLLERSQLVPASIPAPRFSLAMNLVIDRPPQTHAVGGLAGGRFVFMVPWGAISMVGTSHDAYAGEADAPVPVVPDRLEALLADVREALPHAAPGMDHIRLVHRGLLPATAGGAHPALLKRSLLHDHRADGVHGLVTVLGVRYTTARATAGEAARQVMRLLGRDSPAAAPVRPLAGGDIPRLEGYADAEAARAGLNPDLVGRLVAAYGARYTAITRIMAGRPDLAAPLSACCRITGAEVVHAVRHEMAVHLDDVLLRRTAAGTAGHPGDEAVARAAALVASELSWTPDRTAQEIAAIGTYYPSR
jgi:glycerol-3-phosphate dehydrogenase